MPNNIVYYVEVSFIRLCFMFIVHQLSASNRELENKKKELELSTKELDISRKMCRTRDKLISKLLENYEMLQEKRQ